MDDNRSYRGGLSNEEVAEIYRRYGHLLLRRGRARLRDAAAAEDVLQECFVKVMKYGGAYRTADAKLRWLYQVVDNGCFDAIGRRRETPAEPEQLETRPALGGPGAATRIQVQRALAGLGERERRRRAGPGRGSEPGEESPWRSGGPARRSTRSCARSASGWDGGSVATERHPEAFDIESLQVGEGPAGVAAHVAACAACGRYLAELTAEASAFAAHARPERFAEQVRRRAGSTPTPWTRLIGLLAPASMAAATVAGIFVLVGAATRAPSARAPFHAAGPAVPAGAGSRAHDTGGDVRAKGAGAPRSAIPSAARMAGSPG